MSASDPPSPHDAEVLLYQSDDGAVRMEVRFEGDTAWLLLRQMALLFGRDKSVISRHVQNVFDEGELSSKSVVANFATTGPDGKVYEVDGEGTAPPAAGEEVSVAPESAFRASAECEPRETP